MDTDYIYKCAFESLARIASETAGKSASGTVVDLRPLFDYARTSGKEISPELRRLIMSYDVFLFLRDSETGSIKRLQIPNYRWYTN